MERKTLEMYVQITPQSKFFFVWSNLDRTVDFDRKVWGRERGEQDRKRTVALYVAR